MKIYALGGLHSGVFQALSSKWLRHTIDSIGWCEDVKPKPDCVRIVSEQDARDTKYDAVIFSGIHLWWDAVKFWPDASLIYYDLMNSRGDHAQAEMIYKHPHVVLAFVSDGCRLSHGVYGGQHKVIYPGIDPEIFKGYRGDDVVAVTVRNAFKRREPRVYNIWEDVCGGWPKVCVGHEGDIFCNQSSLVELYQKCRVYVNIELTYSTFSIAAMEAMATGMPIISTATECNGEVIRNGVEGFINNDIHALKQCLDTLMKDADLARRIGERARKAAMWRYDPEAFNMQWNDLFDNLITYRRN